MKNIVILNIALILLVAGCSQKEGAATRAQFKFTRGDLTSSPQVFTNKIASGIMYAVDIKLSSAKAAELFKFAQQNPNRETDFEVGSQVVSETRMGTKFTEPPVGLVLDCDSLSKVKAIQDLWTN